MKYLITGGAGFIGANFAHKILERGDGVIVMDNLSRKGAFENIEWLKSNKQGIEILHCDIRVDQKKIDAAVQRVDAVFHLAGQVAVTTSVTSPREDFDANALGTLNVLEAIRNSTNKPLLIYSSTNKVYGGMEEIEIVKNDTHYLYKNLPNGISETQPLDFHSPYGCSKGAADQYVRDYARIYNLKTVVLRQSCIYGTRQFGVEDQGWVAWFTIASILKKPLTIYGDGMQVRDVLYIDDLFNAWDTVVNKIDEVSGQVFNIGGGPKFSLSLLELVDLLEEHLGKKISLNFSNWRPGDQPVYISDITKAKTNLGWEPKTTPTDGVRQLFSWVSENKKLLKKLF